MIKAWGEKMKTFGEFWNAIKNDLMKSLACYDLTADEVEAYMQSEKEMIVGRYNQYCNGNSYLKGDARFKADVSSASYCLEMCY